MSLGSADVVYIVFCRICGVDEMSADRLAAAMEALQTATEEAIGVNTQAEPRSSVYGRFVLVPRSAVTALDIALACHNKAAASGVSLAIGVAYGRLESVRDLSHDNFVGVVINQSARLANLPNGIGRIVTDEITCQDARNGSERFPSTMFSDLQTGQVKRTPLRFHWLNFEPTPIGGLKVQGKHEAETAHVIAYDIARFSEQQPVDMVRSVEELNHAVRRALDTVGGFRPGADGEGIKYAPAGDGGVVVFRAGLGGGSRAVWSFARAIAQNAEGRVPIRIGVATGPVVVLDGSLPVGYAILEADRLSGLPLPGSICVTERFWNEHLDAADKRGWSAVPVSKGNAAALLVSANSGGSSPIVIAGANSNLTPSPSTGGTSAICSALPASTPFAGRHFDTDRASRMLGTNIASSRHSRRPTTASKFRRGTVIPRGSHPEEELNLWLLAYMSDRREHESELQLALSSALAPKSGSPPGPVVCFIPGDEDQCHDMFVARIINHSLPMFIGAKLGADKIWHMPIGLPFDYSKPERIHRALQEELARHLGTGSDAIRLEELAETLSARPGPTVIETHLPSDQWKKHGPLLIDAFLQFWAEWPQVRAQHLLLVCLCVEFRLGRDWLSRRRDHKLREEIRSHLQRLAEGDAYSAPGLTVAILPDLCDVGLHDAEDWVRVWAGRVFPRASLLNSVRRLYEPRRRSSLWIALRSLFRRRIDTAVAMPMEALANELESVLADMFAA